MVIFFVLFFLIEIINLSFYNNFLAEYTAKFFGFNYEGNKIFFENITFVVTNLCSGLVSIAVFAGIIFSFKKPIIKNKIILFVLFSLVLIIINFFRILFILWASILGFDPELVHIVTWYLMSGIILFFWYYSMKVLLSYKKLNELIN
jgi:exosortase/archaeosortase family protein